MVAYWQDYEGLGTSHFDFVVPSEQANFLNISPVRGVFPKGAATIGARCCVGIDSFGEFFRHGGIGPYGFAFIAHNATSELVFVGTNANTAQAIPAGGTSTNVDEIGQDHFAEVELALVIVSSDASRCGGIRSTTGKCSPRDTWVGYWFSGLLDGKGGDQVFVSNNDSQPFQLGFPFPRSFGSTEISDRLVERGFKYGHSFFFPLFRPFRVSTSAFIPVVDCCKEGLHVAIENTVRSRSIGLIGQVPFDVFQAVPFFTSRGIDQSRRGFVPVSPNGF